MKDNKDEKHKEHADFQDAYRRSSNFSQINEDEAEELKIEGDGEVHIKSSDESDESDEEKIKDAMEQLEDDEE
ncbi:hypothetical protein SAMN03097699_0893 [Flavobacteriaceae bacterium MAR_2010_188]|nr:hypothetical protein SAMN03097699_0893 [Flavobacteriaceae bacterium MAR_2010_188]